jgi:hypothetical protein
MDAPIYPSQNLVHLDAATFWEGCQAKAHEFKNARHIVCYLAVRTWVWLIYTIVCARPHFLSVRKANLQAGYVPCTLGAPRLSLQDKSLYTTAKGCSTRQFD